MKKERSAGVVAFRSKPSLQVLLIKHSQMGHWDFPKGWIEKGESEREAALREAKEEAGLTKLKLIPGFKHSYHYFYKLEGQLVSKDITFFLAEVPKGTKIKLSWEHSDYKWLSFGEAIELVKFKESKTLLEKSWEFLKASRAYAEPKQPV